MQQIALLETLQPLLRTETFGRAIEGHVSTGSTNTRAKTWALEGADEGSVVVADYQTAGRGRHGRSWTAQRGRNLTFSVVLRPSLPSERFGLITLAACVAAAEAIEAFTAPLIPSIKWPNDVLLCERKCCGMLLESILPGNSEASEAVILGVGLNVNQDDFPEDIRPRPTSLLLETGRPVPRAPLFARLLQTLERRYTSLYEDDGQDIRCVYEDRLSGLGRTVTLRLTSSTRTVEGRMLGITESGALQLDTKTGLQVFHAGEVTTRRHAD